MKYIYNKILLNLKKYFKKIKNSIYYNYNFFKKNKSIPFLFPIF